MIDTYLTVENLLYIGGVVVTAVGSYLAGKWRNLDKQEKVELTGEGIDLMVELIKNDLSAEEFKQFAKSVAEKTSD